MKLITRSLILSIALASSAFAQTVLVNDPFSDGGRTNGADPNDIAYFTAGGGTLTVATTGTGLTGNALQFSGNGFTRFLGFFDNAAGTPNTAQTLALNDVLQLQFDLRFDTAPPDNGGGFRFGLYNSGGTRQNNDNGGSAGDNFNGRDDDRGYFFQLNAGNTATSGGSLFSEINTDGGPTGGTDTAGVGSANFDTFSGTGAHNLRMKIERTGASQLTIGLAVDGATLKTVQVNSPITTAFDEIVFGRGNITDTFFVDNVNVTYTAAVPEPSTFGLLTLAGVGLLTLRRRRR